MEDNNRSRKGYKREFIEWGVILALIALLYGTGWHTEVFGRLQQAVLWTGIIQADTEVPPEEQSPADYNMRLTTLEGEPVTFDQFKGKVVFLNFWATWCPPCIAEMPSIQNLYDEVGADRDIAFVLVSLDESTEKAREFIERKDFSFPVYHLAGSRPRAYSSTVIPTTYVIDKSGTIVTEKQGMANYHTASFIHFIRELANR